MREIKRKARIANNMHLQFKYFKVVVIVIIVFSATVGISFVAAEQIKKTNRYNEILHTQQQYYLFQHNIQDLMNTTAYLIKGYGALYRTNPDLSIIESEDYLLNLTGEIKSYVKNIGIIKDTTIVYNYPYEANKSTIGVDLLTIESQKKDLLRVKNELITVLIGPINLIQGGTGYIVRTPLLDNEGKYWGQASIVLNADAINGAIVKSADELNIEIAIFKNDQMTNPILGDISIIDRSPLVFNDMNNKDWEIYVIPRDGWKKDPYERVLLIIGVLLGLVFSLITVMYNRTEYRLGYALTHDILTDLYNRRYLEVVQASLTLKSERSRKDYGLFHMDLDNFKYINDTFGHLKGDEVLKEIGQIIKRITRKDELAFRIGGDEFLIMIPEVNAEEELVKMRYRFQKDFEKEFQGNEILKYIGVSIGVAVYPKEGNDFDTVLKHADKDMYEQKTLHKQGIGR